MSASSSAAALYDPGSIGGDGVRREKPEIVIRTATADDIDEFFGEPPRGTTRATVAVMDGKVVGIIGITRGFDYGNFFSEFTEELRPHLRSVTIMRAIKDSLAYCEQYKGPVLALALDAEGCRIMNRLGFTHLHEGWYAWLN